MKPRRSLVLFTGLLILAAGLRLWQLGTLPPGFSRLELDTLSITERTQQGEIMVFHPTDDSGQESLFHIVQATVASLTGIGLITMRLPAVWIGMLTLAITYLLARRLYGQRVALLALGLMAVGFWPILLARLSLRETLVPFFTAATLLAFANAFHIRRDVSPDPPTTAGYATLGLIVATSFYAHWFGLFLAVIVSLAVIYLFATRQRISRHASGYSAFAILISIIIVIPFITTILRAPDLNSLTTMRATLMPENLPQSVVDGLTAIFISGDTNPMFNLAGRPLLDPASGALFVLGLGMALRYWHEARYAIPAMATLVSLVPAFLSTQDGAFLALSGALPLIYIMIAFGAETALDFLAERRPRINQIAPRLLAALITLNFAWTALDLYSVWQSAEPTKDVYYASRGLLANHLDQTIDQMPITVCSPQLQDNEGQPGDITLLGLMMQRQDPPLRFVDCANGLILTEGGATQQFAFTDVDMYDHMHEDLRAWLRAEQDIPISGLEPGSVLELDIERRVQDTVGRMLTTAPTGWAPESPNGPGPATLPVRFGGNIAFLGYVLEDEIVYQPGDVVTIVTYWRVDGEVPPDMRIFTHVLSDPIVIVAQSQALNVWPPSLHDRDVFIQIIYMVLPESTPPGNYDISIGAFQAETLMRLPVFDGEQIRGDRLFLYGITVNTAEITASESQTGAGN